VEVLSDDQFAHQAVQEVVGLSRELQRQLRAHNAQSSPMFRLALQLELRALWLRQRHWNLSPSQLNELRCRLRALELHLGLHPARPPDPVEYALHLHDQEAALTGSR